MPDPTVTASIETTPGVWVALTGLITATVNRGKQNELDRYQAGTCNILLANADRKYDPTYASSPLNGYLLPMKRVRLTATYAAITYPLFQGYADRWVQNREGPHWGTTTLEATDGFKVLERANLASSAYAQEVLADHPVAWWRFDEAAGTVAHDTAGHLDLAAQGTPTMGTDSLISRDGGASATTTATTDGFYATAAFPVTGGPLTIEVVARVTTEAGTVIAGAASKAVGAGFDLASDEAIGFEVAKSPGVAASAASTVDYTDGLTHHIAGVWGADNSLKIYVDGVDRTSGAPTLTVGAFSPGSGIVFVGGNPIIAGSIGVYDEVAIYNTGLSAARVAAHAAAVATPWNGDLPGPRIARVLDAAGWPAADRNLDTGTTVLQSATLDMSALEHAQKVSETEYGNLYVTAGGVVRFEARSAGVNQPVVATFSDELGGDLPITSSDPEISDEDIRNDVTVSRLEGVAQNVRDAASIATYQISSYVRDGLYNADDDHSLYMAQFILSGFKDPADRVSSMRVNPYRSPATLWPAVLSLELTDRLVLNETPQNVAPEVSRTVVVEGVTHMIAAKAWTAKFNLSENTAATQAYWQLGIAGFSELDQTTRLGF